MRAASAPESYQRGAFYNERVILARLPAPFRRVIRTSLLLLHLVLGVLLIALVFPLCRTAQRDRIIMAWSRQLLRVLGVRLQAGPPPALPQGALLVCNHVSWLDIYLVYATQRVRFVSKAEVRSWPVAGWLAHKTGTLFLERGRRADTKRINAEMGALLQAGAWVAVFPEGTTSDGRGLLRFLPSLLQSAVELNCPVVPAALRYRTMAGDYSAAPAYIDDLSIWQSLMQIVSEPGLVAELQFGAPIVADGHRRELAAQAEAATARLLGVESAGTAPRSPAGPPA
jgi:1-acyl-sn-glycerol-3-phosphate acyltransferase